MSDPSLMRHGVARGGALVGSLALGVFVIVNAQLGCDAPDTTAPPAAKVEPAATAEVPAAKAEVPAPATKAEPAASVEPAANPEVEPPVEPQPGSTPKASPEVEPVYMPASKSGGDFGAMQFPGQGKINPAPNAAPTPQQAAPE